VASHARSLYVQIIDNTKNSIGLLGVSEKIKQKKHMLKELLEKNSLTGMLPDGDIQLMKNVADSNKYVPIDLFQTTNALLATKLPKELIVNNKIISDILEF